MTASPLTTLADAPRATAGVPRLRLQGIRKTWTSRRLAVLDGVDLSLWPGDVVSLQGRNGTGKTTLLRIACGLIEPDAGEVRVCGVRRRDDRIAFQRQVGLVAAGHGGLYARLSVRFQLEFNGGLAGLPAPDRTAYVERALERFALTEMRDARVDRLSMGQRQRVRLAIGFLAEPALMVLDEPRNSLDEDGAAVLAQAIEAASRRGGAVLVCSPAGEALPYQPTRSYRLESGRLQD
jgi:ABC-2 type transport system ATP-binding protein